MKKWTYMSLLDSISQDFRLSGRDTSKFMHNLAETIEFNYRFGDARDIGILIQRYCKIAYKCGRKEEAEVAHEAIEVTR